MRDPITGGVDWVGVLILGLAGLCLALLLITLAAGIFSLLGGVVFEDGSWLLGRLSGCFPWGICRL